MSHSSHATQKSAQDWPLRQRTNGAWPGPHEQVLLESFALRRSFDWRTGYQTATRASGCLVRGERVRQRPQVHAATCHTQKGQGLVPALYSLSELLSIRTIITTDAPGSRPCHPLRGCWLTAPYVRPVTDAALGNRGDEKRGQGVAAALAWPVSAAGARRSTRPGWSIHPTGTAWERTPWHAVQSPWDALKHADRDK